MFCTCPLFLSNRKKTLDGQFKIVPKCAAVKVTLPTKVTLWVNALWIFCEKGVSSSKNFLQFDFSMQFWINFKFLSQSAAVVEARRRSVSYHRMTFWPVKWRSVLISTHCASLVLGRSFDRPECHSMIRYGTPTSLYYCSTLSKEFEINSKFHWEIKL